MGLNGWCEHHFRSARQDTRQFAGVAICGASKAGTGNKRVASSQLTEFLLTAIGGRLFLHSLGAALLGRRLFRDLESLDHDRRLGRRRRIPRHCRHRGAWIWPPARMHRFSLNPEHAWARRGSQDQDLVHTQRPRPRQATDCLPASAHQRIYVCGAAPGIPSGKIAPSRPHLLSCLACPWLGPVVKNVLGALCPDSQDQRIFSVPFRMV